MSPAMSTGLWLAAMVGSYFAVLGRGHLREISESHQSVDASYSTANDAERGMLQLESLREELAELERLHDELRRELSLEDVSESAWLRASSLMEQNNLVVERAEVIPPQSGDVARWQRLRMEARGQFEDLYTAVFAIENARPPLRIVQMRVRKSPNQRNVLAELVVLGLGEQP